MRLKFTFLKKVCCLALLTVAGYNQVKAQINMDKYNTYYSQNFDALPVANSDVWESGASYLQGWTVQRTKAGNTIVANNGSSNTGALYSYGTTGASDRALGSVSSATAGEFAYGLLLQNNTGATIKALDVSYMGEQWRVSNSTAGEHRITFWYAISSDKTVFNLSPASDRGWTQVDKLTFFSPIFYSSGRALDGNAAANKRFLSHTLSVNVPDGYYIMLRWKDADEPEADHGLAIDDISLTWKVDTYSGPAPLPVELIKFTARVAGKEVVLHWQTAMEEANDYFVVERSADGRIFEGVGIVNGHGTTRQRTKYSFTDEFPLSGTSYYRLKQVDEDSQFTYSSLASVSRQREKEIISVYPTTTSDTIQIDCETGIELKQATVVDVMGKQVLQVQLPLLKQRHIINVNNLASSSYVLVLQDVNGKTFTRRIKKL